MSPEIKRKYYSLSELAKLIGTSKITLRRAIKKGLLGYNRIPPCGSYRFTEKHIDDYLLGSTPTSQQDNESLDDFINGMIR